jgi:16S rRNA (uracil1498-N3)-methyltransferase
MPTIRLYTEHKLYQDNNLQLSKEHAHYLYNVMRQKAGSYITLFNGIDGQWSGRIESIDKKTVFITITDKTKDQKNAPDLWLCFAPVKNAPLSNLVQKATELGVSRLQPVITGHTVVNKVNLERLLLIATEAAEQSHRLDIPTINQPVKFDQLISGWDEERIMILCDESGSGSPLVEILRNTNADKHAIIIGPEGGFSKSEFEIMKNKPYIMAASLGPRILRADTAAIAAISCYQNILGDWDERTLFK